ncbi:MAG: hypothetical protein KI792_14565 [Alphaproteobacteria bacterium]|nr:hypothetical protein [Alphaproteobacteria bacterium SS10]MBV6634245.1 hypothetical protein [Alphaproteobacteria bacterium SS10]
MTGQTRMTTIRDTVKSDRFSAFKSAGRLLTGAACALGMLAAPVPMLAHAQGLNSGSVATGQVQSYYHDQIDLAGCPHPIALRLPEPFLPVSKSRTLTEFLNDQLINNTFSAVYQSSFYVHEQWAVPSTVSVGIMNRNEEMQGSFTVQDFQSINQRVAAGLVERSQKVKNYLQTVQKTRPAEYGAANYLFNNTFYLNDEHFIYYDVSTVNVAGIYNIPKLNAANFIYVNGCVLFVSVEVIDNLISFHNFHAMNATLSAGMPQADTPRFGFVD